VKELYISILRLLFLGSLQKIYYFFETGQSKWIIATKRKEKKLNLGNTPI
jgi:hypothetical protein